MEVEEARDNDARPLLGDNKARVYYENCPGCKQEQRNEAHAGIPYREFLFLWVISLCAALPLSSLFPFIYFMIRDLHIAKREEDIGFYAGFLGSSYMIARALTSIFWGVVADRYGRKLVIVISIVSLIIFNTIFGLSTSYWMAITSRSLLGLFSGLIGPTRAFASEVCRKEHQALALSLVSTSRAIGFVVGPAIGGYLAQPADKYPSIFPKSSIFGRFPYFLPCLIISLVGVVAFIVCFWLPETLHFHGKSDSEARDFENAEASLIGQDISESSENLTRKSASKKSLWRNWNLIALITVYCVFALQDMAYSEAFSLWAVSSKSFGGLSFSTQDVGQVLAITGLCLLLYQLGVYPLIQRYTGPVTSSRVAAILAIPLLASYPYMTKLSGFELHLAVNIASFLKNVSSVTIITGFNLIQNNAVAQDQRGAVNGISVTAMSIFKAIGPAAAGSVFSWAQKRRQASFLPGDHLVFFVLNLFTVIGLLLTFKPFIDYSSLMRSKGTN